MKYYFKAAVFLLLTFFLQCDTTLYLLREPVRAANKNWRIEIQSLRAGPNSYSEMTNRMGSWGKNETVSVSYWPKNPENGFLWVLVNVENIGAEPHEFDFSRVRLISEQYVAKPAFVYSTDLIYKEGFIHTIKPRKNLTRWLICEYKKGYYPCKLVYDNKIVGSVFDKLVMAVPEYKTSEGMIESHRAEDVWREP